VSGNGQGPPLRLVIGMTGATGVIYGIRLLEVLREAHVETHLVMSTWAERTMVAETHWRPEDVRELADFAYDQDDRSGPLGTGTFQTAGMVVAPCSMKSLALIANGISESLIHRAAEIHLKEGRKLLLVVRESPLSVIHLENMLKAARAGAMIVPPVPAFYARPRSIEEMVDHTVGRLLDHFGVGHDLVRRWGEQRGSGIQARLGTTRVTRP
jgi:polyprenyl P-hydroxybenzoate/phenylacrylic acid decarboxylase-like protein